MSYTDVDTCASTQVAENVFHMLRNNTTNMLRVERDDEEVLEQCKLEDVVSLDVLAHIARMLSGDYRKKRIYDVEADGDTETRRVTIWVQSLFRHQTICDIEVSREDLDGDEVSGWTRWKANKICVQSVNTGGTSEIAHNYTLKRYVSRHGRNELSHQVYENIGTLLCVAP